MKVIYISSPYSIGDSAANVFTQMQAAHRIMDLGHCPVAPLLSHFLHLHRQRPYMDWLNADLALIPKMDAILRLPGESKGADAEVFRAIAYNIPVFYNWKDLSKWIKTLKK